MYNAINNKKSEKNANLFAKLQQRVALKMKTSSRTRCQCNGRRFYREDELNLYLVAMPPSPERPFLLAAKKSGSRYCCTCLYFCLLLLLSVFYCCLLSLLSFIIVVCIIWWPGKLFRLSVLLYLLVFLPFIVVFIFACLIVVFYHCCLYHITARQVIQVVWSCPTVPSKLPSRGLCPRSEYYLSEDRWW